MKAEPKSIVHDLVREYLQDDHPENISEFDMNFDFIWNCFESESNIEDSDEGQIGEGAQFIDPVITDQAIVSIACIAAHNLVMAMIRDSLKRDLPVILDSVEQRLVSKIGRPDIVKKIRERVQGILQNL